MKKDKEWLEIQELIAAHRTINDKSINNDLFVPMSDFNEMAIKSTQLLETALLLKPNSLNYSLKSLCRLSSDIKKRAQSLNVDFFDLPFSFLIHIYCGEVIRRLVGGEWFMKEHENGTFEDALIIEKWEPGAIYNPRIFVASLLNYVGF